MDEHAVRVVEPRRSSPSGRAVAGGVLVAFAAVLTFVAARGPSAPRGSTVVVAARALRLGDRLHAGDFTTRVVDLPADLRAHGFDDVDQLVGAVALGPIGAGEVVPRAAVSRSKAAVVGFEVAVPLDATAFAGDLRAGERVDLLATYGSDADAYTIDVVPDAVVLDVPASTDAGEQITLTVAVRTRTDAEAVTHAARTGALSVVRSTASGDGPSGPAAGNAPPVYQPPVPADRGGVSALSPP